MPEHGALDYIYDLTLMSSTWDHRIMNWVFNGVYWTIMALELVHAGDICIQTRMHLN